MNLSLVLRHFPPSPLHLSWDTKTCKLEASRPDPERSFDPEIDISSFEAGNQRLAYLSTVLARRTEAKAKC